MNEKRVLVVIGLVTNKVQMTQITPFVEAVARGSVVSGDYEVNFLNASLLRTDPEPGFKRGHNNAIRQLPGKKPKPSYTKMNEAPQALESFDIIILIGDIPDKMQSEIRKYRGRVLHLNGYGSGATKKVENWTNSNIRNPDQIPQIVNSLVQSIPLAA